MITTTPISPEDLLDAYLDGTLDEQQRRDFEQRIQQDPLLRREVVIQGQMDASLRRCYPAPDVDALLDRVRDAVSRPLWSHGWPMKAGRIAAMVAVGVCVVLAVQWAMGPSTPAPYGGTYTVLGLEASYRQVVDEGFKPMWRCETDQEFAETFGYQLGQPLVLGSLPAGVEAIGLSYTPAISFDTIALLALVDGRRVIVFVDHSRAVDNTQPELTGPDLHLFQRRLGDLVLYEVSPLDTPKVLGFLNIPDEDVTTDPDAPR